MEVRQVTICQVQVGGGGVMANGGKTGHQLCQPQVGGGGVMANQG